MESQLFSRSQIEHQGKTVTGYIGKLQCFIPLTALITLVKHDSELEHRKDVSSSSEYSLAELLFSGINISRSREEA